jgi:4a-hydroxytetrahydrobiopterin dehydratase
MPIMAQKLDEAQIAQRLGALNGWSRDGGEIRKTFSFKNFYETIAFVNAIAYIANQQDHHPDMEVGYNKLVVKFSTHSAGGLTAEDFDAAGRVNQLDHRG